MLIMKLETVILFKSWAESSLFRRCLFLSLLSCVYIIFLFPISSLFGKDKDQWVIFLLLLSRTGKLNLSPPLLLFLLSSLSFLFFFLIKLSIFFLFHFCLVAEKAREILWNFLFSFSFSVTRFWFVFCPSFLNSLYLLPSSFVFFFKFIFQIFYSVDFL